jgi:hypothetical protein
VALRREQQEQLESKHRENRETERKVRPSTTLRKEERRYACRPFGTNSFKEGAV